MKKPERTSRPFRPQSLPLKKIYRLFFFFPAFFAGFLAAFFFGGDFFAFFLGADFFFAAFLAGFFAAGLGTGFGAGASSSGSSPTITNSSSSASTISSASPGTASSSSSRDSSLSSSKLSFSISIPSSLAESLAPISKGSTGRCSGRSRLEHHPAPQPSLLSHSPGVVKHSAGFPARDCRGGRERPNTNQAQNRREKGVEPVKCL